MKSHNFCYVQLLCLESLSVSTFSKTRDFVYSSLLTDTFFQSVASGNVTLSTIIDDIFIMNDCKNYTTIKLVCKWRKQFVTFGQFVRLCYNEENEADVFKQEVFPTLCVKQATLKYTQTEASSRL